LQLVTIVANLGLRRCLQNGIARLVTCVAIGAGNLVIAMRPGVPCKTKIGVMTINAHTILHADRGFGSGSKLNDWRSLLPSPHSWRMGPARSVASFALQLAVSERATWIRRYRMFSPEYCQDLCIVVAGNTRIGTLSAKGNIGCRFARTLRSTNGRHKKNKHKHDC
jgi:hypothetical protein